MAASRVQALRWQASCLWEMALVSCPPTGIPTSLPAQPLPTFITDLLSESSLLFLLRAREKEEWTDNWMGLAGTPGTARVSLRTAEEGHRDGDPRKRPSQTTPPSHFQL